MWRWNFASSIKRDVEEIKAIEQKLSSESMRSLLSVRNVYHELASSFRLHEEGSFEVPDGTALAIRYHNALQEYRNALSQERHRLALDQLQLPLGLRALVELTFRDEFLIGDFEELYRTRLKSRGKMPAYAWGCSQAIQLAFLFLWRTVTRFCMSIGRRSPSQTDG